MSEARAIWPSVKALFTMYRKRRLLRALVETDNLASLEFALPGHFYSPLPDEADIQARSSRLFDQSVTSLPGIDLNEANQTGLLQRFAEFYRDLPFTDQPDGAHRYYFDNPYFAYGDGVLLYSFLRYLSPRRILEVGSGYSSALMLDVQELFPGAVGQITCIEPFPDRLFSLVRREDEKTLRIERCNVQDVDVSLFQALDANDVLFIDSSHVGKVGSDVLHLLFSIVPRLKAGVIVHIHDVLWPFEYPKRWLEDGRAWNEAYLLRALLLHSQALEILYFNSYMALHHTSLVSATLPKALTSPSSPVTPGNSSIWLRVRQTH